MEQSRNIKVLEDSVGEVKYLRELRTDCAAFMNWCRRTDAALEALFGRDSRPMRDFANAVARLTADVLPPQAPWLHRKIRDIC